MTPDELEQLIRRCDPANPVRYDVGGRVVGSFGLSRRDYFAAAALPAVLAQLAHLGYPPKEPHVEAARTAYAIADAMLAAGKVGP